ncbi:uncharacterized protein KD926_010821 [Aspergillus affinis]|uniref:uncharacterized protein n=1 Tax=Aspergillus affinis TaxID=1070780 RepID=UPI0022FE68F0|nr:uncharacterized protein KD926_010821 [Aspergillus affinis]KAI9038404.1 hypothetical protein KD926_010821 [Aspergillus affinis]
MSVSPILETLVIPDIFSEQAWNRLGGEDDLESPLLLLLRRANTELYHNAPSYAYHLQRIHCIMVKTFMYRNEVYYHRTDSLREGDNRGFDSYDDGVGQEDAWCAGSPLPHEKPDLDESWENRPGAGFWERKGSLKDFTALKYLDIGVHLLWLFAIGLGDPGWKVEEGFSLLDSLPPNLEHLSIRGYFRGQFERLDKLIQKLTTERHRQPPSLKTLKGID